MPYLQELCNSIVICNLKSASDVRPCNNHNDAKSVLIIYGSTEKAGPGNEGLGTK